jgi:hypothetical protein
MKNIVWNFVTRVVVLIWLPDKIEDVQLNLKLE